MTTWVCLTHSARPWEFDWSTRAALLARFHQPTRLNRCPPLASLNQEHAPNWANNLTVWRVATDGGLELVSYLQREHTINHAIVHRRGLVICAWDHLEVRGPTGDLQGRLSHNWLAGGHTVFADALGNYVVSCSGSDAVLTLAEDTGDLVTAWRSAGSSYGENYPLTLDDDIRMHYIQNEYQVSHVNCAYPWADGVLVTLFIQGAVVWLANGSRKVREVVSGHVGCHGGRVTQRGEEIYFADSPRGHAVWCDWNGTVTRTVDLCTKWLHDVQHLRDELYLCTVSDTNELVLLDAVTERIVWRRGLTEFGTTPLLLSSGDCLELS